MPQAAPEGQGDVVAAGFAAVVVCAPIVLTACVADDAGAGDQEGPTDDGLLTVEVMEMYPSALVEGVLSSAPATMPDAAPDGNGVLTCWTVTSDEDGAGYVLVLPEGSEMSEGALLIADSSTWLSAGDRALRPQLQGQTRS